MQQVHVDQQNFADRLAVIYIRMVRPVPTSNPVAAEQPALEKGARSRGIRV
ncbi:hypothetical protein [Brevibacterium sp. RIT 803]|uniref:hypothetical protein n=1 Tax=Brevibacterium sp. RIT 803 TaxID=2810210 RepID=UPI00194EE662|nr:hypothetical protein [Brevibacterium sp. RIT 803]MBM6588838.1 hypothetical protein [Brevibacterium sp. RIT 803]